MSRRQTMPEQWAILAEPPDEAGWVALRRLPIGSGVVVLEALPPPDRRRLRFLAKSRRLAIIVGPGAARVHGSRELRAALLHRAQLILISPLHPTRSHPDWKPLPRMRAATLARLAGRQAIALGGMDQRRFKRVQPLGFAGWAGIDAWRLRRSATPAHGGET